MENISKYVAFGLYSSSRGTPKLHLFRHVCLIPYLQGETKTEGVPSPITMVGVAFSSWSMSLSFFSPGEGAKNIASFGVFAGHDGTTAAEVCAAELHSDTIRTHMTLTKALEANKTSIYLQPDVITPIDRNDAILCESYRRCCERISDRIKAGEDDSGTSAVSLFMTVFPDKSIRCVCANIGDSKCVMYSQNIASVSNLPFNTRVRNGSLRPRANSARAGDAGSPLNALKSFAMTEEHTLQLTRERSRVLGKMRIEADDSWQQQRLTSAFVALPANLCSILHKSDIPASVAFETGYPPKDRINTAEALISSLPVTTDSVQVQLKNVAKESLITDSIDKRISLARRMTFIDSENVLVGTSGKRHNTTRSIGDKNGALACLPTPEITGVTVRSDEAARFILASKGLWATVSEEAIRDAVQKYKAPKELATYLGRAAEMRFARNEQLKADIFIIVVDINPYFISRDVFGIDEKPEYICCTIS